MVEGSMMSHTRIRVGSSVKGSSTAVLSSGMRIMSEASMPFHPAMEEPSNILPSSKKSSLTSRAGMLTCCCLPLVSVKRRSTHFTSNSLISWIAFDMLFSSRNLVPGVGLALSYVVMRKLSYPARFVCPGNGSKSCASIARQRKPRLQRDLGISAGLAGHYRALDRCGEQLRCTILARRSVNRANAGQHGYNAPLFAAPTQNCSYETDYQILRRDHHQIAAGAQALRLPAAQEPQGVAQADRPRAAHCW